MKKAAFTLAILMAANLAISQTDYDVLPYFSAGDYWHTMMNVMQMRDESIVASIRLLNVVNGIPQEQDMYARFILKVSRDCSTVLDTVMIEDHAPTYMALMEPNPDGEGYLYATIKTDEIMPKNHLSICRFDEDLTFDVANEVKVPLEDSIAIGYEYFYLDNDDIILYYPIIGPNREFVLSRFDTDGSLKHRQVIADSICPINQHFGKIKVWSESPKKYVVNGEQCVPLPGGGASEAFYRYCVLDSLFGIEEMILYSQHCSIPGTLLLYTAGGFDDFESLDDSTYIFTTHCIRTNTNERGTQVSRRDKRTHDYLKTIFFPFDDPTGLSANDQIIGIRKSSDNYVYTALFNNGIIITKMDIELNVIWQRRYHSSIQNEFGYTPCAFAYSMRALDDGGLAIGGNYSEDHMAGVFVFTLNADGTTIPEAEAFLRPYLFYPNPTQDQLHLQYSPDVKPARIELYDLQGRLVRSQSHGLESVEMQGLSAGQYLMKVTLEDGKVFTDKVVKE